MRKVDEDNSTLTGHNDGKKSKRKMCVYYLKYLWEWETEHEQIVMRTYPKIIRATNA